MTEQEKHLSLAIDALTELQAALNATYEIHHSSKMVKLSHVALGHLEAAAMPKPSRIRLLVQRVRREAA